MAYIQQTDIENVLPPKAHAQLTDDTAGLTVSAAVMAALIAGTEAEVYGYLRGKHESTTPYTTSTVPAGVLNISIDIYVYKAYSRRLEDDVPQVRIDNYEKAKEWFADVRDNDLLINDPDSVANNATYYKTNKDSDDKIFTDAYLLQFPSPT